MKVLLYLSPGCGVCIAVKHYLKTKDVRFGEIDVSHDPDALQEMVNLTDGVRTVPVVAVDGEAVVGFDRDRLEQLLGAQT